MKNDTKESGLGKPVPINVLPPAIFNLLAAGEVVENPASIVKETVENSLDAGATEITVAIKSGGIEEICVTDNGCGVVSGEIHKVFLPHATSKIKTAKDLEGIGTLGFRGEALSSIASVSKAEFLSRTANEQAAAKLQSSGTVTQVSANQGTQITISNLFYNTPARKKFLKSPRFEQNNVTAVVQKLILSNPKVRLKYVIDGTVCYEHGGGGLSDAIELIYGKEISGNILCVNAKRKDLKLTGFVSSLAVTKKNRTWQTVMINGRAVEGGIVAAAANEAFSNYLLVGTFPFFVLDLTVDLNEVDVNVHPRKMQVKFANEAEVFEFTKNAIVDVIDLYLQQQAGNLTSIGVQQADELPSFGGDYTKDKEFVLQADKELLDNIKYLSSAKSERKIESAPRVLSLLEKAHETNVNRAQINLRNTQRPLQGEIGGVTGLGFDTKILGTIFDTYILLVSGDNFFMIDQHAAHERLLYDELSKLIDSGSVATQVLAEPSLIYLTPAEMNQMELVAPALNKMGFECETFGGNCFRITKVPVVVSERGIDTVIGNVLREVKSIPQLKLSALLKEKVILECCKNAIKAGQSLTNPQINYFLAAFKKTKITPLCPHGRPVIISFTKLQIEKMFSRKF